MHSESNGVTMSLSVSWRHFSSPSFVSLYNSSSSLQSSRSNVIFFAESVNSALLSAFSVWLNACTRASLSTPARSGAGKKVGNFAGSFYPPVTARLVAAKMVFRVSTSGAADVERARSLTSACCMH